VLVLLPPSEAKTAPARGRSLDLDRLSSPELIDTRRRVLDTLVRVCRDDPDGARRALGLSLGLAPEITRNAALPTAATARADRVYTGVLYGALDLGSLDAAARRRATSWVVVTSGLFGIVRVGDRIPAYRLPGDARLPGLGPVAAVWRGALTGTLSGLAGSGPVLDLRSTSYVGFWRPTGAPARRTVQVRVLQDDHGQRRTVSHFNKATKGRLLRSLLASGQTPRSVGALLLLLDDLGWRVERRSPTEVDVVVSEV